ncbi:MAG TPA: GGDEF domain-containing protein, partial [Thermoanaerobaculia bacterium]
EQSSRSTDLVARYGGEEFSVMMPETDMDAAIAFAEKLRRLVESTPIDTQAGALHVTVSVGIATVPHRSIHAAKELIVASDNALYRAKEGGRNQVQIDERLTAASSS